MMATFRPNVPITTRTSVIKVDTARMKPGIYRLQLVVIDNQGNRSRPDLVEIKLTKSIIEGGRIGSG